MQAEQRTEVFSKRRRKAAVVFLAMAAMLLSNLAISEASPGLGQGPDNHSEIIKLDLDGGGGQFMDANGDGGFMQIRTHTNWAKWDNVAIGDFSGRSTADVIFHQKRSGFVGVYRTDGNGALTELSRHRRLLRGSDTLHVGNFSASPFSDVLAVDWGSGATNGKATFLQYRGQRGFRTLKKHTNWWPGWDDAGVGNFTNSTYDDLVLINYDQGTIAVQKTDGRGNLQQISYSEAMGNGFDDHAVGDFNDDGIDDVVVIDFDGGRGEMWKGTANGRLKLEFEYTNWSKKYSQITAGDFVARPGDDMLLIDTDGNVGDIYEFNSTFEVGRRFRNADWGAEYDDVIATRTRERSAVAFPDPKAFTTEAFGIGEQAPPNRIPLVLVLTENSVRNNTAAGQSITPAAADGIGFTRRLLTRGGVVAQGNVRDYFLENSDRSHRFERAVPAGAIGPFTYDNALIDNQPQVGERIRESIVDQMAAQGFDFASFDRIGGGTDGLQPDGKITNDELIVAFMEAGGRSGAERGLRANPEGGCHRPPGVAVELCIRIPSASQANFEILVHEIAHSIGAIDLYGSGSAPCRNRFVSLMDCSRGGRNTRATHLDPWHKLNLGWETAASYRLNEPGACVQMGHQASSSGDPVILWDPERGMDEYFILENRSGASYDRLPNGAAGIFAWRVQIAENGLPAFGPARIDEGPNQILDTPVHPQDFLTGFQVRDQAGNIRQVSRILEGADRILNGAETVAGDDILGVARMVSVISAPVTDTALAGVSTGDGGRGFTSSDGAFTLNWSDGSPLGVEFKINDDNPRGFADVGWYQGDIDRAPTTGPGSPCFRRINS